MVQTTNKVPILSVKIFPAIQRFSNLTAITWNIVNVFLCNSHSLDFVNVWQLYVVIHGYNNIQMCLSSVLKCVLSNMCSIFPLTSNLYLIIIPKIVVYTCAGLTMYCAQCTYIVFNDTNMMVQSWLYWVVWKSPVIVKILYKVSVLFKARE